MTTEIVPYEQRIGALSLGDIKAQVNLIQHVMREVMQGPTFDNPLGTHYGIIPGTGKKPTLLKAGAEKLCLTFRLDPQYESTETYDGQHLTVKSKCVLYHIPTGQRFGSGEGSCSTKEAKYAYRDSKRKCPECGWEAIIKGKDFKGDGKPTGWLCFVKRGGCGAKFADGDERIEGQKTGRFPNEDLADQYNTVLKMANKRSLVAAVLNATAASDIFTQDIEDQYDPRAAGGTTQAGEHPPSGAASAPETRTQALKRLCQAAYGDNWDVQEVKILDKAGVRSAEEISEQDWREAKAMLERKITRRAKLGGRRETG